jgi:hypothetical protein
MSAAALLDRLGRPGDLRLGTTAPAPIPRLPTGVPALDGALDGGLPRGRLSEIAGPRSAGRTGVACAIAARATAAGETIAWVDAEDALDPDAAAAAGIALARTLWVRPRRREDAPRAARILLGAGGFGLVVLDLGTALPGGVPRALASLARAVEGTRTALVALLPAHVPGGSAAVTLAVAARRVRWSGGPGRLVLLDGIDAQVTVARSRIGAPGRALVLRQACA